MANNQANGSELNRMLADQQRLMTRQATGELRLFQNLADGAVQSLESVQKAAVKTAQTAAKSAARAAGSVVRYAASFDELERLPAAKSAGSGSSSGGSGSKKGSSSGSKTDSDEAKRQLTLAELLARQLRSLQKEFGKFWEDLAEKMPDTVQVWSAAWQAICTAAQGAWADISSTAGTLWQGTLVPMAQWLVQTFVPEVIDSFSQAFAPIVQGIVPAALQGFATLFYGVCSVVQSLVQTVLAPAFALALQIWQDMMAGIQAAWAAWGQPIVDGIGLAVENLVTLGMNLWSTVIQPILLQLMGLVDQLWTEHLQRLWDELARMFGSLTNLVLTWWNNVLMPFLNWVVSVFGPMFNTLFGGIGTVVTDVVGTISDLITTLMQLLQGLVDFVANVFAGNWDAAWQGIQDTMAAFWENVRLTMRSVVNGIIDLLNGMLRAMAEAVNTLGRILNSLNFTVPDWVPVIGGSHVGFQFGTVTAQQIPRLASGGVIRQPTLAMMGEYAGAASDPEIAAPQSAIAQAVSDANGDVVDAVLTAAAQIIDAIRENGGGIVIGDEVIGRAMRRYNNRQAIITGGAVY